MTKPATHLAKARATLADLLWEARDKSGLDVEVRLGCGQVALSDQPCDVCRQARKARA